MANYTRQGQDFRAETSPAGGNFPVNLLGAHKRTYDGVQTLTLSGSPQSLSVPGNATHADIYCAGATSTDYCRYWHVTSATLNSSLGAKLKDSEVLSSASPSTFRAINSVGSCILSIEYYHYE